MFNFVPCAPALHFTAVWLHSEVSYAIVFFEGVVYSHIEQ